MLTRRVVITGLVASALIPGLSDAEMVQVSPQAALDAALHRSDTLAYFAARAGLLFGCFLAQTQQDTYFQAVSRECSLLNISGVSPRTTRKSPSGFDFRFSDQILALARNSNLAVCGGYLAAHDNVPSWITPSTDRSTALAELQLIVRTTMAHFGGQFDYWIVSNEAIVPWSKQQYKLRDCSWLSTIGGDIAAGTDYVTEAFRAARAADPTATLVYSDYGIEDGDAVSAQKRAAVLALLGALKRDNLVDALGIQGHLSVESAFDQSSFQHFLDSVSGLGLNVVITELDVNDASAPAEISSRDSIVAQKYAAFLQTVLEHEGVKSVTVWGLSDRNSWLNSHAPRSDGQPQRGDLLDADLARKRSYDVVRAALQAVARR